MEYEVFGKNGLFLSPKVLDCNIYCGNNIWLENYWDNRKFLYNIFSHSQQNQDKKSHFIFHANNSLIFTQKNVWSIFSRIFHWWEYSHSQNCNKSCENLCKNRYKSMCTKKFSPILLQHWWLLPGPVENGIIITHKPRIQR